MTPLPPSASYPAASQFTKLYDSTTTGDESFFLLPTIPGNFAALLVTVNGRAEHNSLSAPTVQLTFNGDGDGDPSTNYDFESVAAAGSSPFGAESLAGEISIARIPGDLDEAGPAGFGQAWIPDYAGPFEKTGLVSTTWKTSTSSGGIVVGLNGLHWRNTDPITSVRLTLNDGTFVAGSRATAYLLP